MNALLPVEEALARILSGVGVTAPEIVELDDAAHRVLAQDLPALRTQPPFAASAMDGFAVRSQDIADIPCTLQLTGESAAGRGFRGTVGPGETVRIFTGAPLPKGADTIIIQENVETDGQAVRIIEGKNPGRYIRPAGLDFSKGDVLLTAGRVLDPFSLSLAASMNYPQLPVRRRPKVGVVASGDELLPPGETPGDDQIIASNSFGVLQILRDAGADVVDLGIAADTLESLEEKFAAAAGCDVVVTLGGASVGDHDLVRNALEARGVILDFWALAMKPGKPVMFGRTNRDGEQRRYIGLPGNPVSSLVCSVIFLVPLVRKFLGLDAEMATSPARLDVPLSKSGPRKEFMRATSRQHGGEEFITPFDNQDSSMLSLMAKADCLMIRPPNAGPAQAGDPCEIIPLGLFNLRR